MGPAWDEGGPPWLAAKEGVIEAASPLPGGDRGPTIETVKDPRRFPATLRAVPLPASSSSTGAATHLRREDCELLDLVRTVARSAGMPTLRRGDVLGPVALSGALYSIAVDEVMSHAYRDARDAELAASAWAVRAGGAALVIQFAGMHNVVHLPHTFTADLAEHLQRSLWLGRYRLKDGAASSAAPPRIVSVAQDGFAMQVAGGHHTDPVAGEDWRDPHLPRPAAWPGGSARHLSVVDEPAGS